MAHRSALDRRRFLATAAAAVAAGAIGGPALATRRRRASFVDELQRDVGVIGDSITAESEDLLFQILRGDGFSDIRIDAERNRRITVGSNPPSGVDAMTDLLMDGFAPSAWIIALGTNDIGSYDDAPSYGLLIAELLAMVPSTTPLVWVDVHLPDRLENCQLFNDELARQLRARGAATVASWSDANGVPDDELLRSDRIHPSERGHVVFATLMATALRRLVMSTA